MPQLPALPAALVGVLGALATVLGALAPVLSSPWHEVVVAFLALLTTAGVGATQRSIAAHRAAVIAHVQATGK